MSDDFHFLSLILLCQAGPAFRPLCRTHSMFAEAQNTKKLSLRRPNLPGEPAARR
jgi:hypothetical protein